MKDVTQRITRRKFVKMAAALAAAGASLPILSACATTPSAPAATATQAPSAPAPAATQAPAPTATAPAAKKGGNLRIGTRVDPQSLDPHHYKAGGIDIATIDLLMDGLVTFDRKMTIVPQLATEWDWPDNTTLRFKLRQGVVFQDGTPFNAQAAKVNIDRMSKAAEVSGYYGQIGSCETPDDSTVVIKLKAPFAPLLRNLASPLGGMVSPAAIDKYGEDLPRNPVGTGPYMLDQWLPKQQLVMKKNPTYWGTAPNLDTITLRPFPEEATRLLSFQAGELDVIQDPVPSSVKQIEQDARFQVLRATQLRNLWLGIENGDQTLENVKLRQAIAHAVDRKTLVDMVAEGLADVAESLVPPDMMDLPKVAYPFDPAKAKQLLSEAGYAQGIKLNLWAPQGRYLKDKEIGEAVQAQLKDVGIDANLQVWEWGAYNKAILEHQQQLWIQGWGFLAGDPDGMASLFGSKGAFNSFNLKDDQVDQLFAKGVSTVDEAARKSTYGELQKRLVQDLATVVPIYFQVGFYAATKKVHELYPHPLELIDLLDAWIE
ncbi:MAG: ABC transporter substrate-binding protein [Chloroflexota bacterium]